MSDTLINSGGCCGGDGDVKIEGNFNKADTCTKAARNRKVGKTLAVDDRIYCRYLRRICCIVVLSQSLWDLFYTKT